MIFATGGTIAGRGASSTASGVYQAGSIGVGALVDGKPTSETPLCISLQPLTVDPFIVSHSRTGTAGRLKHLRSPDSQRRQSLDRESSSYTSQTTLPQADTTTPLLDR